MTTGWRAPVVCVAEGVVMGVGLCSRVGVNVGVTVPVDVGVAVGVAVLVAVLVGVTVAVEVAVGVGVNNWSPNSTFVAAPNMTTAVTTSGVVELYPEGLVSVTVYVSRVRFGKQYG